MIVLATIKIFILVRTPWYQSSYCQTGGTCHLEPPPKCKVDSDCNPKGVALEDLERVVEVAHINSIPGITWKATADHRFRGQPLGAAKVRNFSPLIIIFLHFSLWQHILLHILSSFFLFFFFSGIFFRSCAACRRTLTKNFSCQCWLARSPCTSGIKTCRFPRALTPRPTGRTAPKLSAIFVINPRADAAGRSVRRRLPLIVCAFTATGRSQSLCRPKRRASALLRTAAAAVI